MLLIPESEFTSNLSVLLEHLLSFNVHSQNSNVFVVVVVVVVVVVAAAIVVVVVVVVADKFFSSASPSDVYKTHQFVCFDKLCQLSHSGLKGGPRLQSKFTSGHFDS